MIEYRNIIEKIQNRGITIPAARENMPSTKFLNSTRIPLGFNNGFPILTGKKMPFYSIVAELVGFMKGVTDVREFDKLGTKVWWDNAYKWNIPEKDRNEITLELYKNKESQNKDLNNRIYDLGRIYSAQWRHYRGLGGQFIKVKDQLKDIIESINNNPYSRYHVITAWNPIEMNPEQVSQPNCHVYFQASCTPFKGNDEIVTDKLSRFLTQDSINYLAEIGYKPNKYLYTHLTQRSCDMFLGVPFNLTSYSLFTILLSIFTNSIPIEFIWNGVNSHIYSNHNEAVDKYLNNELYKLPLLDITGISSLKDIEKLNTLSDIKEHFKLIDYKSNNSIKADLSVGL